MKVAAIVCFTLTAAVVAYTAGAAISFGREYGYRGTFGTVVVIGSVISLIPLLTGLWFWRRSRKT